MCSYYNTELINFKTKTEFRYHEILFLNIFLENYASIGASTASASAAAAAAASSAFLA